jgi:16S rRNA (guanine527-N7)-methyltransferase
MGLSLAREARESLWRHAALLQRWGSRMNLTAVLDPAAMVAAHFLDSLALLTVLEPQRGARLVDIGSGAGFPGLPLGIVRPDVAVTLVERSEKKAVFLKAAAHEAGCRNVTVFAGSGGDYARTGAEGADLVVSRATAGAASMAREAEPLLAPGGLLVLYKGPGEEAVEGGGGLVPVGGRLVEIPGKATPRLLLVLARHPAE